MANLIEMNEKFDRFTEKIINIIKEEYPDFEGDLFLDNLHKDRGGDWTIVVKQYPQDNYFSIEKLDLIVVESLLQIRCWNKRFNSTFVNW